MVICSTMRPTRVSSRVGWFASRWFELQSAYRHNGSRRQPLLPWAAEGAVVGEQREERGVEGSDLAVGRVCQVPQGLQPAAHEGRALRAGERRSRVEDGGEACHDAALERLADAEVKAREVG